MDPELEELLPLLDEFDMTLEKKEELMIAIRDSVRNFAHSAWSLDLSLEEHNVPTFLDSTDQRTDVDCGHHRLTTQFERADEEQRGG